MRPPVLIGLFLSASLAVASAAVRVDTFDGSTIDSGFWAAHAASGLAVSQQHALIVSGVSTDPTPNWAADAHVESLERWQAEGLVLSVDLAVSGTGSGWWAGMYVGQDAGTWIHVYVGVAGSQPVHVGYAYAVGGAPLSGTWLATSPGSRYTMAYSEGVMRFLVDGTAVGQQAVPLSLVQIALGSNVRTAGDSVYATFDNFSAAAAPEPPAALSLVCCLGVAVAAAKKGRPLRSRSGRSTGRPV